MTGQSLAQAVKTPNRWPTPLASEARQGVQIRREGKKGKQQSLTTAVMLWPKPAASDHKGSGINGQPRDRLDYAAERGVTKSNVYPPPPQDGGQLNPTWVEWLMGWPLGWTELTPLAMDKYQSWLQQHLNHCQS